MPISEHFTSIYEQNFEINFLNCYPNGLLKHTELLHFIQITAANHAELGGINYSDMQQYNQTWVLSRLYLEIKKLPQWKDSIIIKTWIKSFKKSISTRCIEVYLNQEKIVGCEMLWAVFNTSTRKPDTICLPFDHFEMQNKSATNDRTSKIINKNQGEFIQKRGVLLSDLDIVKHVNNVKYLEWCIDILPINFVLSEKITTLNINFIEELSIRNEVEIYQNSDTISTVFTLKKDGNTVAIIALKND